MFGEGLKVLRSVGSALKEEKPVLKPSQLNTHHKSQITNHNLYIKESHCYITTYIYIYIYCVIRVIIRMNINIHERCQFTRPKDC